MIDLRCGDCLEEMQAIPDGSVDMILCDLPYGTTACKWDQVIPFAPLWAAYRRVIKKNGAIVLTASQPFTSLLVCSNLKWFRYEWIWDKVNLFTNQMNAARMPMKQHENICVFSQEAAVYNPQKQIGKAYKAQRRKSIEVYSVTPRDGVNEDGMMFPGSVIALRGRNPNEQGFHPTQKPVSLMSYLIQTYTNVGETVLDNCMGSGTTGVACIQTGRNFIGIEKDPGYFAIAERRICEAQMQTRIEFDESANIF